MIIYIAHPVGPDGPDRVANLARARRWFDWLLGEYPDDALVMPWLLYCDQLEETADNRARGIRDDLEVLERCDAIILCGGEVSDGMADERNVALREQLEVIDLTLGQEPPRSTDHVVIDFSQKPTRVLCQFCGAAEVFELPMPVSKINEGIGTFAGQHATCEAPA